MKQIDTSLPYPDNLMDTGGLTPIEPTTTDHPGEVETGKDNTQAADNQILEIGIPQNDMDLFCGDMLEDGIMAPSDMIETPIQASTCATGNLRDRTTPPRPVMERTSPTNAGTDDTIMSNPIESANYDVTETTPTEQNTPCETDVVNKTVRVEPQDHDAQILAPHSDESDRKICAICGNKGHVFETCLDKGKGKIPILNIAQMYHMGQNNNCHDMNATWVKRANMDQLAESFQDLRPTGELDSPETSPAPLSCTDQPPMDLELEDTTEEGELRPSPVVRRKKITIQKGGDPRTGNIRHIENGEGTEDESTSNANPTTSAIRWALVEEVKHSPVNNDVSWKFSLNHKKPL